MKKYILILITILLNIGCSTYSKVDDNSHLKTDEKYTEQSTKRKGDTVTYIIPKITYKDTVIYTQNKQGTILKTVYDKSGSVAQIECYASAIDEINKLYTKMQDDKKDIKTESEKDLLKQFIPFLIVGVVFLIAFAMVLIALVMYFKSK